METRTIVIITIIISSLTTLFGVLGIIFADINLFILAIIILIITLIPAIKYFDDINEFFRKRNGKIVDDERTKYIESKSSIMSFATVIGVCLYATVGIFTLRNTYPEYINLAYPFLIIFVIGLAANMISTAYYKRKYSD